METYISFISRNFSHLFENVLVSVFFFSFCSSFLELLLIDVEPLVLMLLNFFRKEPCIFSFRLYKLFKRAGEVKFSENTLDFFNFKEIKKLEIQLIYNVLLISGVCITRY